MIKIQVIIGSTRQNRFGEKPAKWIFNKLKENKEVEAELIDLRDWPLPFFDEPMSPMMSKGKYTNPLATKWADKIGEADAYILVTPEYNHAYSAVLKNALDYVYMQWNKKPVAFVAYGSMGGARAVEQLRGATLALKMVPIYDAVHISAFWNFLDEKGNLKTESFEEAANTMIEQLLWCAKALKTARDNK